MQNLRNGNDFCAFPEKYAIAMALQDRAGYQGWQTRAGAFRYGEKS